MNDESLVSRVSPISFVRNGGGTGFKPHTRAHPAVLMVLVRHDTWEAAFAELVALGLSDEDIWSGHWRAEWRRPADRQELMSKLAAARRRGGPPVREGLTVEVLVATVRELTGPDGPPTEAAMAESLGLSERWVRKVARRAGGWAEILRRAADDAQAGSG
jgi:hypothetical protein